MERTEVVYSRRRRDLRAYGRDIGPPAPRWSDLRATKLHEFRRVGSGFRPGDRVLIYETSPCLVHHGRGDHRRGGTR